MKCAILNDYQDAALKMADWSSVSGQVDLIPFRQHIEDEDALAMALQGFHIVVLMRERTVFPRSLFAKLPDLQLLVTTGASNPSIDIPAAAEFGVTACGTASLNHPTAELTWGLILGLLRHIPEEDRNLRGGGPWQLTVGVDLKDKVLGILGLGILGSQVARVGKAFGMKVIVWSHNLTPQRCADLDVTYVTKTELFEQSDILSIRRR